jgi:hypothetical protein
MNLLSAHCFEIDRALNADDDDEKYCQLVLCLPPMSQCEEIQTFYADDNHFLATRLVRLILSVIYMDH